MTGPAGRPGELSAPAQTASQVSIDAAVERAVRHDRAVVIAALVLVTVLAWAYILAGAGMGMTAFEMTVMTTGHSMGGGAMMMPAVWSPGYALIMFGMWWVMMIAMMLPSASPMILLFAGMNRKARNEGNPFVSTALFASAYLIVWGLFSVAAVAVQWGLEALGLLTPALATHGAATGGALLLAAGLYQLTPLKQACLIHCRSPLQYLIAHWRGGIRGALRMGAGHGIYCVGCCWFLMGLLFFGGVMNLIWIAGLAIFVLIEKTVPPDHWISRAVGVALVAWGLVVLSGILF